MADAPDSPHERLTWARLRAGYEDKAHFAKVAGVNPTTYRAYENGQNGFAKLAAVFGRKLGVSAEWLLEGGPLPSGEVPTLPDQPLVHSIGAGDTVEILQLDLTLSMGPGTAIEDFVESELVSFDAAALRRITRTPSDKLRFVTGIGTSHEPKFLSGDQFLIDINDRRLARLDGYYWITFEGAHGLKRLRPLGNGRIQIISENPDYAPMDVSADAVRIEGRAIWFARGL